MKLKTPLFSALLAGGLSLVAASFTLAANSIYLKIPGVVGPVQVAGYQGDIQLNAYSQAFSNTFATSSGGSTGGKAVCGAITIQKSIDATSHYFLQDVTKGSHIASAEIYFLGASTGTAPYTIKLTGVFVTSISQGDNWTTTASNLGVQEIITLQAEKFQFSYTPQNPDGSFGSPVIYGWDCFTNTAF